MSEGEGISGARAGGGELNLGPGEGQWTSRGPLGAWEHLGRPVGLWCQDRRHQGNTRHQISQALKQRSSQATKLPSPKNLLILLAADPNGLQAISMGSCHPQDPAGSSTPTPLSSPLPLHPIPNAPPPAHLLLIAGCARDLPASGHLPLVDAAVGADVPQTARVHLRSAGEVRVQVSGFTSQGLWEGVKGRRGCAPAALQLRG